VNNSCVTGESEPQTRSIQFTNENQLETKNLLFRSTFAVEGLSDISLRIFFLIFKDLLGSAKGVVIRTGDRTVIGRIANSIPIESTVDTPITKEITQSISSMTRLAIFLGIFFFIMAISLGYPFIESLILLIVMIIVNAPKSLSIIVTVNNDC
jgi:sodium/potassium-transporting ATPase subunit alpha